MAGCAERDKEQLLKASIWVKTCRSSCSELDTSIVNNLCQSLGLKNLSWQCSTKQTFLWFHRREDSWSVNCVTKLLGFGMKKSRNIVGTLVVWVCSGFIYSFCFGPPKRMILSLGFQKPTCLNSLYRNNRPCLGD